MPLWLWFTNIWLLHQVRITHPITKQRGSHIPVVMLITWLDLEDFLLATFGGDFFNYFLNCRYVFFLVVKQFIGHILRMIGPIDVKRKGAVSVGFWVNYVTRPLSSLMTLTLTLNFEIAVSQKLPSDWCETKDTGPTVWPCPLTTPISLTLMFQGQILK